MYFTQVGQIGTPVIVAKKAQLPTPNAANVGRYYITTYDPADSTDYPKGTVLTVKQDGSTFSLVAVFQMPAMTNPLESAADVINGKQAVDNKGQLVTGTFTTVEKTIDANGTFYPADDNAQAYSKVTVNVAGETAENPYIATTDSEMAAYLAAEYKDSFVRMDYAKYRVALPAAATSTTAILKCESIGIPRMCAYIDKWLGSDSEKVILNLQWVTGDTTINYQFKVYRKLNDNGTYAYAFGMNAGEGITPIFVYNAPDGTVFDNYPFHPGDFTVSSGWLSTSEGSIIEQLNQIITVNLTGKTGQYTVAVSDALVLTNMAGSEVDNKYVEGAVYKVDAKYVENNTYVAESPFQVGDQLAGATVYLNQQITSDEFEAMCDELAKVTDFGFYEGMFIFANIDYPLVEPQDPGPFYTPLAFLFAEQRTYSSGPNSQQQIYYQLGSYSLDTGSSDAPVILGKKSTANGLVTVSPATPSSFTVLSSITINDAGTFTVPATITKINFPTLLNAIAGKTANFTKQSTIVTTYVPVLQAQNGVYEEAQTEAKLDAKIVNDNIGKIYQYTGTTGNKYKNQSLYIIMED